jgi:uncharacterized protein YcfJ
MKRQKEGVGGRERTRAEQKNEGGKSPRRKRWTNGEERRKECTRPEKDEDDEGGRAAGRVVGGWVGGWGEGERRFLLRPASKMALAAAPLVIKINN